MARAGLRFEKKGSGAIVFVGDIAVKASSIDRSFGLGNLCKRLGDFEPGEYAPEMPAPAAEPISGIAVEEWREYRRLREQNATERREARIRRDAAIAEIKARHTPARQGATAQLDRHGLPLLNIARHFLKNQQREELHSLREAMPERGATLPRFRAWLFGQNPRLAALLKLHRRITPGMNTERREFPKTSALESPYRAYRAIVDKRYPEPMDDSRRDAMTALWMRATGYTIQDAANELFQKARPPRKEKERRDWRRYARETARYAFTVPGDIDIAAASLTQEQIARFTREAEQTEAAFIAAEKARTAEAEREQARSAPGLRMR